MLKAIIFDFDGVICESLEVKIEAMRKLFLDYPEQLTEIVKYHMDNGGMSRYKKFDYIYKEILKKPLSQEKSKQLGQLFTDYCYDGVVKSDFVPGAEEFLKKYYKKLLIFVISGTPEDEMIQIVDARKMAHFFKGVYGSPATKDEVCKRILKENNLRADEVVFIGDSVNDLKGAESARIRFIGRLHQQYPSPFPSLSSQNTIRDINELESLLKKEKLI